MAKDNLHLQNFRKKTCLSKDDFIVTTEVCKKILLVDPSGPSIYSRSIQGLCLPDLGFPEQEVKEIQLIYVNNKMIV